ncbi:hypothetical protein [Cohnella zeiphila]|uniref:Uncharacterized protein n=1 Tax=Cohnella zeiphila TaxID=2761120 RepID=A0A7X0SMP0_9BACL|nr:hypothetical protein [Cohnella zeiphila]MBB6730578.1 hypothetical protein [Cohnella zeiphila]
MNKRTLFAIAEWAAVLLLIWLFYRSDIIFPHGSSTPEQAHRLSESSYHYGPSKVVRKVAAPFDPDRVVFLGTYKIWFSADTVVRKRGGWWPNGGVAGVEIDRDKPFSYSWEGSATQDSLMAYKFYGYVTDDRISAVELLLTDRNTGKSTPMREEIGADRMFLFLWEANDDSRMQAVRGLDKEGSVVYEQELG